MKLLAKRSCSYQILDCSQNNVENYLGDVEAHAVVNSKVFKKRNHVNIAINDTDLAKAKIEHN